MSSRFDDPHAVWRECERAWATWLNQQGYTVHFMSGAVGNATTTLAPLADTPGARIRQPDMSAAKAGTTEYWEVKYRSTADVEPLTGVHQHWMIREAFNDYRRLARATQMPVNLALFEAPTATNPAGRWLCASMRELRDAGHEEMRAGRDGVRVRAWVWPVRAMTQVPGPPVSTTHVKVPILPDEGDGVWLDDGALERAERRRRWPEPAREHPASPGATPAPNDADVVARRLIDDRNAAGLAAACSAMGLAPVPQYSVTRVGPLLDEDNLLGLIEYGIRVFVVSDKPLDSRLPAQQLDAFRGARMLEDAVVTGLPTEVLWAVDGCVTRGDTGSFEWAMTRADEADELNYGQWQIVHSPRDENVRVSAGAGTGKTETMAERMCFLLATQRPLVQGAASGGELTPEHFAFITFTREAALQMRARLGRALMLRQRLCRHCVAPVIAWMLQLSNASISTIHSFAKEMIRQTGPAVQYAPNFRVGQLTMQFRQLLQNSLSSGLADLNARLSPVDARRVPPAYAWEDHLEVVWGRLENNGLPLMQLDGGSSPTFAWGTPQSGNLDAEVFNITRVTLEELAKGFGELCREEQVVPTSQLVPLALSAIRASEGRAMKELRHLFIDEFQDTDAQQISLFVEVHQRTRASMFVVGDVKQGIYRFRGAAGNAFSELEDEVEDRDLTPFKVYRLTRNFRSGRELLDSLHPLFNTCGKQDWLEYGEGDELRARESSQDHSVRLQYTDRARWTPQRAADKAAEVVVGWRSSHRGDSLAILCRENWQARLVKEKLRSTASPASCTSAASSSVLPPWPRCAFSWKRS